MTENETVITRPRHDEALAAQIKAQPAGGAVQVNPNPVGSEVDDEGVGTYVGTDPIYQNSGGVANRPFDAEEGVDKLAEDRTKELYNLSDEDEENVAPDYGMGGEARVAKAEGTTPVTFLAPGQEGYDKEQAEAQQGPLLRVDAADQGSNSEVVDAALDDDEKDDGEPNTSDNEGQNFGSTVNPPTPPETVDDQSKAAGDQPAKKAASKPRQS